MLVYSAWSCMLRPRVAKPVGAMKAWAARGARARREITFIILFCKDGVEEDPLVHNIIEAILRLMTELMAHRALYISSM